MTIAAPPDVGPLVENDGDTKNPSYVNADDSACEAPARCRVRSREAPMPALTTHAALVAESHVVVVHDDSPTWMVRLSAARGWSSRPKASPVTVSVAPPAKGALVRLTLDGNGPEYAYADGSTPTLSMPTDCDSLTTTATRPTPYGVLHVREESDVHTFATQSVLPTRACTEASKVPKREPRTVSTASPDWGPVAGVAPVTTGAAYPAAPTRVTRRESLAEEAEMSSVYPTPGGTRHDREEDDCHLADSQAVSPRRMVGVAS
mmetsp:Transcript_37264/g.88149  ORF Transcript_37264/g.88149 Transcript_37264/m.88149 type:complete len:262 (-) Transcript_37264:6965-7750(-)